MVPLVSVPFHGRAQGRAQGRRNATRTHGGGVAIREGVVWHTTRPFFAVPVLVFRPRPDDTRRASGEGLDGSDPPFLTAGAVSRLGGVAPVRMYPCGKAPRPARGPDDQPHRAARYVTHSSAPSWSSATSAPRAPGRGRACSPRPTPWPCSSATPRRTCTRRSLPGTTSRRAWPLSPTADGPAIVVGEVHHPVRAIESPTPEWLTIPERGLSTGVAMFGAVGSGKTSACLHPFARQLLS